MTTYIASLITDALTEFVYDADLAGLAYSISEASAGLSLVVSGYNEKAHVLLKRVLEKARTLVIDPHRFEVMREQVPLLHLLNKMTHTYVLVQAKLRELLRRFALSNSRLVCDIRNSRSCLVTTGNA